jgi:hypothetical protein
LLRINRLLASVEALIKATETETTADSCKAYSEAYAAFLEGCRTIEAVADDLEDIGYAGPISPIGMEKSPYRCGKPNTIFEAGKLVGGRAWELVRWLRELEQALLKARKWLKAQKPPKPKAAIFDATARTLIFLKGKPIKLGLAEKYVLEILVKKRTASFRELQAVNHRPDQVLRRLLDKYPKLKKFIFLPHGGGKGGYSTTIEPSESDVQK